MVEQLGLWLVEVVGQLGYPGIVLLMALESSVIPVPSELVIPPAGYLAAQGEMNAALVVACGVAGSLIGAYANYWVAAHFGRWVFVRYGRYVLLSQRSLERTERFFERHGEVATFVGRLLPVVRHLVSIPAGLARMQRARFFAYTAAGATIWCTVLAAIGWVIGRSGAALGREVLRQQSHRAILAMLPILALIIAGYVLWQRRRGRGRRVREKGTGEQGGEAPASGQ